MVEGKHNAFHSRQGVIREAFTVTRKYWSQLCSVELNFTESTNYVSACWYHTDVLAADIASGFSYRALILRSLPPLHLQFLEHQIFVDTKLRADALVVFAVSIQHHFPERFTLPVCLCCLVVFHFTESVKQMLKKNICDQTGMNDKRQQKYLNELVF